MARNGVLCFVGKSVAISLKTRPDTRPSVAYGWAGAVMLKNRRKRYFYESVTDGRTDGRTNGPTDGHTLL